MNANNTSFETVLTIGGFFLLISLVTFLTKKSPLYFLAIVQIFNTLNCQFIDGFVVFLQNFVFLSRRDEILEHV